MNKPLQLIFLNYPSLIFIFAVLFACCGPEIPKNSSNDAPPEMERLLLAADTLNVEDLAAEAQKLPGTWVDTFFAYRYWALLQRQDGPGLKVVASAYEKTRPDNAAAGAFINLSRGCAYQFAARLDSAEIHYKLAQDWYQQKGDKDNLIKVMDCRATNCDLLGRYDESIALKSQILNLTDAEDYQMYMKMAIAQTLIAKADTSTLFELLQTPLLYYEQARDTFSYTWALTVQANAFLLKKDYPRSIELHQKSLSLRRQIGKVAHSLENMSAIATTLNKIGNWQAALDTVTACEKILAQINAKQGSATLQSIAGEALFYLNRLPEADAVLLQNIEDARVKKRYPVAMKSTLLLSKSKKKQGKLAEALDFQTQHLAYKDSIYSQEKEKIIQEAAVKYETREKQAEITTLKLEKQLADQRNLLGGGFLLSVVGTGAWFLRYRHRREKALLEKDIATKRLENEVLIANENLNRQMLESAAHELELHKAQLEEFTALMLEKNTKIEALQPSKGESVSDVESNLAMQNALNDDDVDALFQSALLTETDWQRFQKHFEKVFPGILNRLRMEYQQLSIAELRLVLLTKMGLKTNEIAVFIGISPESVRKLRYLFKKKMGISEV